MRGRERGEEDGTGPKYVVQCVCGKYSCLRVEAYIAAAAAAAGSKHEEHSQQAGRLIVLTAVESDGRVSRWFGDATSERAQIAQRSVLYAHDTYMRPTDRVRTFTPSPQRAR